MACIVVLVAAAVDPTVGPSLFGLVPVGIGLAARGDGELTVEQLREDVERFLAGEDVDFGAGGDDDLSRLSAAVGDLAEALRSCRANDSDGSDSDGEGPVETRLRAERERFTALFENASDAILHVELDDGDVRARGVNPQFTETFGQATEDIAGDLLREHIVPPDHREESDALARRAERGEHIRTEVVRDTPDGEREFLLRFVPIGDRTGTTTEGYAVYTDITERKERERQLEALVENTESHIYIKDRDGRYRFVNAALADFLDCEAEAVVGKRAADFFDEATTAAIHRLDEQVIESGETITEEITTDVDGQQRVFLDSKYPYRDQDGAIVGVMGVSRDITERKDRERKLAASEARYRAIAESANDAIVTIDGDSVVRFANPAVEDIFGYGPDELVGESLTKLMPERYRQAHRVAVDQFLESGERSLDWSEVEFPGLRKDGEERDLSISFAEHERHGETRFEAVIRDITERKERERTLQETKQRLELALEGTDTGIWEWNLDTGEETWDETAERLVGLDPGEFGGTYEDFTERVHLDDLHRVQAATEQAIENDGRYHAEFRLFHENGDTIWVEAEGQVVTDEDGTRRLVGINHDITERKERERKLADSEERLRESEQYRQRLYEIASDTALSDEEKMERLLELGCERLGVENGHIVDVDRATDCHEIVLAAGSDLVETGTVTPLSKTYCRDTISSSDILCIHDAPAEGYENHPGYREWDIGCYIGGKIEVGPELYGTVCFVDREPRAEPFTHSEKVFMDLVARWLSSLYERRASEAKLQAEHDRFAALFENSTNAVAHVELDDEDLRVLAVNSQFTETFGDTNDEIVGRRLLECVVPEDRQEQAAALVRKATQGEHVRQEVVRETPNGRREFIGQFVPIGDGDTPTEGYVVYTDITEQKERERALAETKRRLQIALEGTNTGIWDWNLETDEVDWDETAEALVGLDPGEFGGTFQAFRELAHPEDLPRVEKTAQQAIENDELYRSEFRMFHENGDTIWVEAEGRHVIDEDGTERLVGINHDITERKRAEQELRERERRLQRYKEHTDEILDSIDDVFYVVGPDVQFRRWNRAMAEVTGYDDAEIADLHPTDIVVDEDQEAVASVVEETFESGSSRMEVRVLTADGETIPYEFAAVTLEDPDGDTVLVGIGRDITDRKERERELERTRDLLSQSQRIADVGGWELDARTDPPTMTWTDEVYRIHDLPADVDVTLSDGIHFYHPDDRERIREAVEGALDGEEYDLEARLLTAEGDQRWVRAIGVPVREDGEVVAVRGSIQDITEAKEREQELRTTKERIQRFIEASPVGVVATDPEGTVTLWNDGMERIFGWTAEEILGKSYPAVPEESDGSVRQRVLDGESVSQVELERVRKDGQRIDVTLSTAPVYDENGELTELVGFIQDITERKERERELERTKELLQQAGRVANFGGWELDVTADPPEMTWSEELYDIHGVAHDADLDTEAMLEYYHPDDREHVRSHFRRALKTGTWDPMEVRALTPDGELRWVRVIGSPVYEDGELVASRGSVQDITEQKERELALESLHETTRGLLRTESDADTAKLVVEAGDGILDVDGVAVYLLDAQSNELDAVASTAGFEDCTGGAPSVQAGGGSLLWNCFVTGTSTVFDDTETVARSQLFGEAVSGGLAVPIGDHGVFVVAATEGTIADRTRRLAETLVATAEAAFDRIESEATLQERDAELERRNQRLHRQIQITDTIRRIDRSLVGVATREEIERTVCDQLVAAEDVAFAWVGETDTTGDVTPRAWAGTGEDYLDAVTLAPGGTPEPAVATAESGEPTVVGNVLGDLQRSTWRREALAHDFHSVVSVPITFEDYSYGVLTVYGTDPDVFGDLERSVFAELGENIAHSINAVETRQALHAETLVELTLELDPSDDFLGRLASEAGCSLEFEGLATHADEEARLFFSVDVSDAAAVESVLDSLVAVDVHRLIAETDDHALFEVTVGREVLPARLVRHGASPRSLRVTETGMEVVVDVPTATDVRTFVEMVRDAAPSVELTGRRTVERATDTRHELVASLLDSLTDRQLEVLRTAFLAGFFDWPRKSTGEDVAEMLGVSQPTVNRHLRLGQQQLLAQLFDERGTEHVVGSAAE